MSNILFMVVILLILIYQNIFYHRQFCGLVVGLDQAVGNLVQGAKKHLGEDTVVIVTSDNGEDDFDNFEDIYNFC